MAVQAGTPPCRFVPHPTRLSLLPLCRHWPEKGGGNQRVSMKATQPPLTAAGPAESELAFCCDHGHGWGWKLLEMAAAMKIGST